MPLKNPSFGLAPDRRFSPLWRRIQRPFSRDFLAATGSSRSRSSFTCRSASARASRSATSSTTSAPTHAGCCWSPAPRASARRRFCTHTLDHCSDRGDIALVWVDVLRDVVDVLEPAIDVDPNTQVARQIADKLNSLTAPSSLTWRRFFLEHCTDPSGVARNLREELATTGTLREASQDQLNRLLAETERFLHELIRIHLEYLWSNGRQPVLVIDNVDQLKTRYIDALGHFASVLAKGTNGKRDAARVIAEYRQVISRGEQERFDNYYGDATITASLCECLLTTDRLTDAIKPYQALIDQARALKAKSSFESIRQAAEAVH